MFGQIPERKVVTFNDDAAWTPQEKKASLWLCALILLLVGLPSLSVAVVSTAFNAMFAYSLGATPQEKAAWLLASLGFSLFVIGIPIARPIIREQRPDLDRKALWLWLACVFFSITSALGFSAKTRDQSAAVSASAIEDRGMTEDAISRIKRELDALPQHRPDGTVDAAINTLYGANPLIVTRTDGCKLIEHRIDRKVCAPILVLQEELSAAKAANKFEAQLDKMRANLKVNPSAGTISDPQAEVLDWISARKFGTDIIRRLLSIFVALLVEAGSAVGLSIAAEAFVTILRERSNIPTPLPQPTRSYDLHAVELPQIGTQLDAEGGFAMWADRCVSIVRGASVRASEAFGRYETWSSQNGMGALPLVTFGRRMTDYVIRRGGSTSQSNGRVYQDVRLSDGGETKLLAAWSDNHDV